MGWSWSWSWLRNGVKLDGHSAHILPLLRLHSASRPWSLSYLLRCHLPYLDVARRRVMRVYSRERQTYACICRHGTVWTMHITFEVRFGRLRGSARARPKQRETSLGSTCAINLARVCLLFLQAMTIRSSWHLNQSWKKKTEKLEQTRGDDPSTSSRAGSSWSWLQRSGAAGGRDAIFSRHRPVLPWRTQPFWLLPVT